MNIVTYQPKSYLNRFFDNDRFFDSLIPWAPSWDVDKRSAFPKINVVENADDYTLTAEVPGMKEGDINVEIEDGTLTLTGRQEEKQETEEKNYRMREFQSRSFARSFRLGDGIDADRVSARIRNGMLTVALPRKEEAKPKSVKVKFES